MAMEYLGTLRISIKPPLQRDQMALIAGLVNESAVPHKQRKHTQETDAQVCSGVA